MASEKPAEIFGQANLRSSARRSAAPIADVSGEASLRAALAEVSEELTNARADGRIIVRLPLAQIDTTYLVRDRIEVATDDLQSLVDSIAIRGQQAPIEVVALSNGQYGLISGWRRLTALQQLAQTTDAERFGTVQALVRAPKDAAAAYLAMVEENEIRVGLSFYERARIAVKAVQEGVHENTETAVAKLFAAARAPKRSKILSFVVLVEALDPNLKFPRVIPEKLGLALVSRLKTDTSFRRNLTEALRKAAPESPEAERSVLERSLMPSPASHPKHTKFEVPTAEVPLPNASQKVTLPGMTFAKSDQRLVIKGPAVTSELTADILAWLQERGQK